MYEGYLGSVSVSGREEKERGCAYVMERNERKSMCVNPVENERERG